MYWFDNPPVGEKIPSDCGSLSFAASLSALFCFSLRCKYDYNMSAWTRLVRFEDDAGDVRLGQPADNDEDIGLAVASGKPVDVFLIQGDIYTGTVTNKKVRVKSLLAPISRQECSLIRCLGLNFREHAKEAGLQEPKEPVLFIKPRTSLAGPGDLPVSKWAQDDQLDYETELACVISQDAKDITEDKVPDYILG